MKILAIDDTKTLLSLLSLTLRNAGHEVAEAENGEDGLNKFDQFRPDLVITDLNMPIMDGIEFTRACRSRAAGQNTPIIVLTTENGAEIKAEGRRAGASVLPAAPVGQPHLRRVPTLRRRGATPADRAGPLGQPPARDGRCCVQMPSNSPPPQNE